MLYTQLLNLETDEYRSAVTKDITEAHRGGFKYVCCHENLMLFRKPK